jgi:Ca-activated chloride channel family protein
MEKHLLRIIIIISLFSPLCSCGKPVLQVLYGNYRYNQGEYTQATISYMRALETGQDGSVVEYNLGNVYHALGETDSAIKTFVEAASEGTWEELIFRSHYNLGGIYFELGSFDEAVHHYIQALLAQPNEREAKINLELALKKLDADEGVKPEPPAREEESLEARYQDILNTMRKEGQIWKSPQEETAPVQGSDW